MSSKNSETPLKDRIDWVTVIVPFLAILALCVCFILMPDASKSVLDTIRFILGDTLRPVLSLPSVSLSSCYPCIWHFPDSVRSASGNRMKSQNIPSSSGRA
ncbi:MAG: hypothetical protein ACLUAR_11425 [Pilosibacter sp.]